MQRASPLRLLVCVLRNDFAQIVQLTRFNFLMRLDSLPMYSSPVAVSVRRERSPIVLLSQGEPSIAALLLAAGEDFAESAAQNVARWPSSRPLFGLLPGD